MKPFNSFLADKFEEYLRYRHTLGYTVIHSKCYFRHFDRYLIKNKNHSPEDITSKYFLDFLNQLDLSPLTINRIITTVRAFYAYLVRLEIIDENPLQEISYLPEQPYIPYIFSMNDTEHLLKIIRNKIQKDKKHFFRDYTIYMIILLLARCGLRISEAIKLELSDCRIDEGTLYIRKTKFNKDRLIPVPQFVMQELANYLAVRKALIQNKENPHLYPGKWLYRIDKQAVYSAFYQAVKDIGINQKKKILNNIIFGKPTPHCLRHSFAINTLKRIRDRGDSTQAALPVLAAYMGHKKYQFTAVYLKALDAEHRKGLFDITLKHLKDI